MPELVSKLNGMGASRKNEFVITALEQPDYPLNATCVCVCVFF